LIDAEVCQTDPDAAAIFIEKIKNSPEEWFRTKKVQQARQEFLDKYLGPPEALMGYLLKCAKSN